MQRRRGLALAALAIGAVTCGAGLLGVWLVQEPAPPPAPRAAPPRAAAPVEAPVSDLRWDPAAWRAAAAVAVPVGAGAEFEVVTEFPNAAIGAAVLDASRRAMPLTIDLLGGDPDPQLGPYAVHVVRTRQRVRDEARRLDWTPPWDLLGFADLMTGRIYLTTDDLASAADALALAGPGSDLTIVAAHEAAHQVAARCLAGAGSGADWICEGIAEYVGELVAAETYTTTELGAIPYFAEQMRACQGLLAAGVLPTAGEILADELPSLDGGSTYAVHWAFFRFLHEPPQRERTRAFIARLRDVPWTPARAADVRRTFEHVFGAGSGDAITTAFREHVRAFAPQWSHVRGRLEVRGDTWTQVATGGEPALAMRAVPAGRAAYRIVGAVEILPQGDQVVDVLLGETDAGSVQVSFQANRGVGLWIDPAPGPHRGPPLAYDRGAKPVAGRRCEFVIEVAPDKVTVFVDRFRSVEGELRGRDMSGAWGVDCVKFHGSPTSAESAAVWHGVRLE